MNSPRVPKSFCSMSNGCPVWCQKWGQSIELSQGKMNRYGRKPWWEFGCSQFFPSAKILWIFLEFESLKPQCKFFYFTSPATKVFLLAGYLKLALIYAIYSFNPGHARSHGTRLRFRGGSQTLPWRPGVPVGFRWWRRVSGMSPMLEVLLGVKYPQDW